MLELLMSVGGAKAGKWFPNSGPGNKELLFGTPALGYFGVIPSAEVMSYKSYKDNLNPNMAITMSNGDGWFKFFYRGKIIYMSCKAIGYSVSWEAVYQAGGVYGVNNIGTYPVGNPKMQYRPMTITSDGKPWTLIPRLPHTNDVDGGAAAGRQLDTFEYNSLMGRLVGNINIPEGQYVNWYGKWASFDHVQLDMDKSNLGMETGDASNRDRSTNRGGLGYPLNAVQPVKTFVANTVALRGTLELYGYLEPF